jgi:hypothetical protein
VTASKKYADDSDESIHDDSGEGEDDSTRYTHSLIHLTTYSLTH